MEKKTDVCVGLVGLGNMVTAVANLAANNGYDVIGWEHHASVVEEINQQHTNSRFLPNVELSHRVTATTGLGEVAERADVVFVAIPSAYVRSTLGRIADQVDAHQIMVNMAKGIDAETGPTYVWSAGGKV